MHPDVIMALQRQIYSIEELAENVRRGVFGKFYNLKREFDERTREMDKMRLELDAVKADHEYIKMQIYNIGAAKPEVVACCREHAHKRWEAACSIRDHEEAKAAV